ncbi:MFS general substrate transporter [Coniophora puteana RWD-64-598 SS2]|uniref:MFS general substrate transporter n=1 Tax=Coniophora puteana (strain RWD-64-598) TaxID=741705 RepID=A0A5M3MRU0_CONPW|nr:MFS general substrate transporter [Coniophora puteana RWD-64-598 SS2]EIW81787.1 MFS general substrate transporter [Coniophora puteana RWD-64-598 SS2]
MNNSTELEQRSRSHTVYSQESSKTLATHMSDSVSITKVSYEERRGSVASSVLSVNKGGEGDTPASYTLYRERFVGVAGLMLLGIVTAMPWPWFGPISTATASDFDISIDAVNWLGNIVAIVYIPVSLMIPLLISRFGIRRVADFGVILMLIGAWVRYVGTVSSLPPGGTYALLFIGQILAAIVQPIFQIIGPLYSERWFSLQGRTTATMLIGISNAIGGGLSQVLSPLVGTPKQSILVLAVITSAVAPATFLIGERPPTPPTYSGSQPSESIVSLVRAMLGMKCPERAYMSWRERLDFTLMILIFGALVGASNTFSILSAEYLEPAGYSDDLIGLMGASLLLAGIIGAIATAPLFDRYLTHHYGVTLKTLVPLVAAGWLSLVWAVKPDNTAALFAIFCVIGVGSMIMLPIGRELGCELTRSADGSAALLWCSGSAFGVVLNLAEGALRAGADASPPYNMRNGIILHGVVICVFGATVFALQAKQVRRQMDEAMQQGRHSGAVEEA